MHSREHVPSFTTSLPCHSDKANMVAVFEVRMRTLLGMMVEKHPQKKKYVLETSREVRTCNKRESGKEGEHKMEEAHMRF